MSCLDDLNDFYGFYGFYDFYDFNVFNDLTNRLIDQLTLCAMR
jgi:hypothetical protein